MRNYLSPGADASSRPDTGDHDTGHDCGMMDGVGSGVGSVGMAQLKGPHT